MISTVRLSVFYVRERTHHCPDRQAVGIQLKYRGELLEMTADKKFDWVAALAVASGIAVMTPSIGAVFICLVYLILAVLI